VNPEVNPQAKLQANAAEVVTLIQGVTRALMLYAPNNDTVIRLVDMLVERLETHFGEGGEAFQLQLLEKEFFVNGQLLKLDPSSWERATQLAEKLVPLKANALRFGEGTTRAHIEGFVADLAESLPRMERKFQESYGELEVAEASGTATATFRFEPDKLAVWLYTSLVELCERLYEEHAADRAPSLVPLKRTLQLVIDNMATHGGIYQLLTTLHRPGAPPGQPMIRAAVAIEAIGFGHWLGLSRQHLLSLGLAGLLGGIEHTRDPDEAVKPIFRYPGLGAAAISQVLVLHDTRSVRAGGDAGVLGRLLGMVETYIEVTLPRENRPRVPPFKALKTMRQGKLPWIEADLIEAFCDYKGPLPLGSLVKLTSGHVGVVLGRPDPPAKGNRPLIGLVSGNELKKTVDLRKQDKVKVAKVLTAEDAGVDLFESASQTSP